MVHFIHHQFIHFIDPEKLVRGLMNNFVHFIHLYMNLLPVCGIQYVRSTVDRFRLRWNNYKCPHRVALECGTPKQNYFHQHFLSEDHHVLPEDCEITLIDKIASSVPTRREFFWIHKLKTFLPLGPTSSPAHLFAIRGRQKRDAGTL